MLAKHALSQLSYSPSFRWRPNIQIQITGKEIEDKVERADRLSRS
jgi:hypothetical protein